VFLCFVFGIVVAVVVVIVFAAVGIIPPDIKLLHPEGSNNNTPKISSIVDVDGDAIF
jgi:hypothetical protein